MKRVFPLLLLLLLSAAATGRAQTVIDLKRGGGVRAKTLDDYKIEHKTPRELAIDSLAYNDCLTRAFNELHRDSLHLAEAYFERALKLRPEVEARAMRRRADNGGDKVS